MRPNLLHPVAVQIAQLDKSSMVMDDDAREPIHGSRSTSTVTVQAQISWQERGNPVWQEGGPEEKADGHITLRLADLNQAGVTLKRGDQIVAIGSGSAQLGGLQLFLTKSQPMGHYPDQGGFTLVRWYFQDRAPSQ